MPGQASRSWHLALARGACVQRLPQGSLYEVQRRLRGESTGVWKSNVWKKVWIPFSSIDHRRCCVGRVLHSLQATAVTCDRKEGYRCHCTSSASRRRTAPSQARPSLARTHPFLSAVADANRQHSRLDETVSTSRRWRILGLQQFGSKKQGLLKGCDISLLFCSITLFIFWQDYLSPPSGKKLSQDSEIIA